MIPLGKRFLFIALLVVFGCEDKAGTEEIASPPMNIFGYLENYSSFEGFEHDDIISYGMVSVHHNDIVQSSKIYIDGLLVDEEDTGYELYSTWSSNEYDYYYFEELSGGVNNLYTQYEWQPGKAYELKIITDKSDDISYEATSSCTMPSEFAINEALLDGEFSPGESIELNWSNSSDEDFFALSLSVYDDDFELIMDTVFVIEANTNDYTILGNLTDFDDVYYIYLDVAAINTGHSNIEGFIQPNIEGDGIGRFHCLFSDNFYMIRQGSSNKMKMNKNSTIFEEQLKQEADRRFKQKLLKGDINFN